jgi:hypothetical protein
LHGAVACFGAFTLISRPFGKTIAAGLMSEDAPTGRIASLAFSACAAGAVAFPVGAIWLALAYAGRPMLDGALVVFEGFARAIGAL